MKEFVHAIYGSKFLQRSRTYLKAYSFVIGWCSKLVNSTKLRTLRNFSNGYLLQILRWVFWPLWSNWPQYSSTILMVNAEKKSFPGVVFLWYSHRRWWLLGTNVGFDIIRSGRENRPGACSCCTAINVCKSQDLLQGPSFVRAYPRELCLPNVVLQTRYEPK